jgi:uncharacterized protein (TIGR03067 family)
MKAVTFLLFAVLGLSLQARTWTDAASGRTIEAEFVRVEGEEVVVRLQNGSVTKIAISRLSATDQEFVKKSAPSTPSSGMDKKAASTDKEDASAILGTWEGYMADSDGSRHGDIRLVITADKITASNPQGDREMGSGTYKISGRRIDATGTEGQFAGKKYEGIFDLEGKTLKWCSANDNPRSQRPDKLQTNTQAGQFLMVLEKK